MQVEPRSSFAQADGASASGETLFSPRDLFFWFASGWKVLAVTIGLFVLLALLAIRTSEPTYRAEATILFLASDSVEELSDLVRFGGFNPARAREEIAAIGSSNTLSRVLAAENLAEVEGFGIDPEAPRDDTTTPEERAFDALSDSLEILSVPETRLVRIVAETADPALSARIANAVPEAYASIRRELESERVNAAIQQFRARVQDLEEVARESDRTAATLRRDFELTASGRPQAELARDIARVADDLRRSEELRRELLVLIDVVSAIETGTPPIEIGELYDFPSFALAATEYRQVRATEAQLGSTALRSDAEREAILARAAALEEEIGRIATQILTGSRRNLELREEEIERLRLEGRELDELAVQRRALEADVEAAELDAALAREMRNRAMVRLTETMDRTTFMPEGFELVAPAVAPDQPTPTRSRLLLAAALVMGFVVGCAILFFRDAFRGSFSDLSEITGFIGSGGVSLPRLSKRHLLYVLRNPGKASGAGRLFMDGLSDLAHQLCTEADDAQHGQLIVVTSPLVGDGKSTISAGLAVILAQRGQKVLLVDGDWRRSGLTKLIGQLWSAKGAVPKFMGGEAKPPKWMDAKELPFLKMLNTVHGYSLARSLSENEDNSSREDAGGDSDAVASAREALDGQAGPFSDAFRRAIDITRGHFDVVIVDTPPAGLFHDAAALAENPEAKMLMVVRQGWSEKEDVEYAFANLAGPGGAPTFTPGSITLAFNGVRQSLGTPAAAMRRKRENQKLAYYRT